MNDLIKWCIGFALIYATIAWCHASPMKWDYRERTQLVVWEHWQASYPYTYKMWKIPNRYHKIPDLPVTTKDISF